MKTGFYYWSDMNIKKEQINGQMYMRESILMNKTQMTRSNGLC
jgi:hypothetical protein